MGFLSWLVDTDSGHRIEHPVLGEAVYFKAKLGSYWEVETEVAGVPFTLILDAENRTEPSEAQVAFFQRFALDPKRAFDKAAPLLAPEFERWVKRTAGAEWQSELSFVGMSVPRDGDEQSKYELSFEGPRGANTAHFACTLERGVPTRVEVST